MTITKIEIQKNNKEKVNIFVDDKYSFSLTLNGLLEFRLKEGQNIDEEEIAKYKKQDSPKLASIHALNILGRARKTEKELEKKLKEKGYDDDSIEYAINKMKEYKYIDDDSYVESYIKDKISAGWGEKKIIAGLYPKGISPDLVKEKLEVLYFDEEKTENITKIAEKYLKKIEKEEFYKKKQKLYRHLLGQGYSYDLITSICNKLMREN